MALLFTQHPAPGGPGIPPRWTRSDKDGVGTAYSFQSRVWFTISSGILNEVYYPTIDLPQIRDLQYLITDGETFFHDSRRNLTSTHEYLARHTLGFRIVSTEKQGRYRIIKEIIADPRLPCILIHTRLEAEPVLLARLRLFALLAPHLEVGGWGNDGYVAQTPLGEVLTAHKGNTWLVLGASVPFVRRSCGYVGTTDGWQDLASNFQMDWQFDCALNGNIALTGELDLSTSKEFVLGLAFGHSLHQAMVRLAQSLGVPFPLHRSRYIAQWSHACESLLPEAEKVTGDNGHLYRNSYCLVLAHEDKTYDGALIASLSIPWGEVASDDDLGGYHLVWTRDMYNSATALLSAGDLATPFRALIYLACSQRSDGGFFQNFWINGKPYWTGIQLDETAFPIMLAWRLHQAKGLQDFDPWPMVQKAAAYLVLQGPATPMERWEENGGFSPSTLAAHISALICAAILARRRGQTAAAQYLEEYADFLVDHLESWTVTTEGTLVPGIRRHFIRIHPVDVNDPQPDEDANHGTLLIKNRAPGTPAAFPAKDVVDAGFLELVRYGILKAGDALIEDSLRVIDAVLKVETPFGPSWRRYNHDGYGQREDGGPFVGWGLGHAWPLLTGERGHYELAAGRNPVPFLRTMEAFATTTALLPEQVWARPDRPEAHMFLGRPTGGAMPLLWAHAEYLKLVRSAGEGQVFDLVPDVANRYRNRPAGKPREIWKHNRQVRSLTAGGTLRIQAAASFRLRWSADEWQHAEDTQATASGFGPEFVDIPVPLGQRAPIRFTFFWPGSGNWEGRDYQVVVAP